MADDKLTPEELYEIDRDMALFDCSQSIKKLAQMVSDDPYTFVEEIFYFEGLSRDCKSIADNLKSLEKRAA